MNSLNNYIMERIRVDNIKFDNAMAIALDTTYDIPGKTEWEWSYDGSVWTFDEYSWKYRIFKYKPNKYMIYFWSKDCCCVPYATSDDKSSLYIFELPDEGYTADPKFPHRFEAFWNTLEGSNLADDFWFSKNINDIFINFDKTYGG